MARRTSSRPPRGLWRHSRTDSFVVHSDPVIPPLRVWAGALLRARAEVTCFVVALVGLSLLHRLLPWAAVIAVVVLVAAVVLGVPASCRAVTHRAQAVITRHQLRATLVESRCWNASGQVPWLLWARPSPVGETVWLLLPPGLAPSDVVDEADTIASGCWARTARVTQSRSNSALIRVEVFRRDPLTRAVIRSALADYEHRHGHPVPRGTTLVTPVDSTLHTVGARFRHHGAGGRSPQPEPIGDPDHDLVTAAQAAQRAESTELVDAVPERGAPVPEPRPALSDEPEDAHAEPTVAAGRGGDWSDYV